MIKSLLILALLALTGCVGANPHQDTSQNQESTKQVPNLKQIQSLFYEKLKGQTLTRTYGKDTGQTKLIFENDGGFRGDYFGKIASDGKDYGLTDKAWLYYHGEEIHSSEFEGAFEITGAIDDYTYELSLKDFKITSKVGCYDDIYYHVDFALGLNPEASYLIYRPGCPIKDLEKNDRLIEIAKKGSPDRKKTRGFIIFNRTDGEVFSQNP